MADTETMDPRLKVIDGLDLKGSPNVSDETMAEQIRHAIRQGFPQAKPQPEQPGRIALVGSGPSLNDTLDDLRQLVFEGATVVTVNGSYHWCLEHNIHPKAQVVLDARPDNVRFLQPAVPRCKYFLASQCHADVWASVEGRPDTYVFHAVTNDGTHGDILNAYYGKGHWMPIVGGTTVTSRAISLFRAGGFLRFDLFGIDSCWMGEAHHAFDQPENSADRRVTVTASPSGRPDLARTFECAPWHLKQAEDFLQFLRFNGHKFRLSVHGDGLLAHMLSSLASSSDVTLTIEE